MKQEIHFSADAGIISRLGIELVAKQETALLELIKNSYDADATTVEVVFHGKKEGASLTITDNGAGMSRDELVMGFMRLASDLKVKSPRSQIFDRERAGRKGIGRFSAQRLGETLVLTTKGKSAKSGLRLTVDWNNFVSGLPLGEVAATLEEVRDVEAGTKIEIGGLRDDWSKSQIQRCWRAVIALQQPFPVANVKGLPRVDPGFDVRFIVEGEDFFDEETVVDFKSEIFDHLHALIELEVDDKGRARWRLTKNKFGSDLKWRSINHHYRDTSSPPPYATLRNVWMKAYYVIIDSKELSSFVYTRIRDVVGSQGGIRLYRNGFRVVPYGAPDNDWLRLDESYAKRSALVPMANRNFFGVIDITDPEGLNFEEHTSREGLIETPAFADLRELVGSVLATATQEIGRNRGRKVTTSDKSYVARESKVVVELREALRVAQHAAEKTAHEQGSPSAVISAEKASIARSLLDAKLEELEQAQARLADEATMLRFLATLGMTTAEFSHETGMTFDAFRMDFERVFNVATKERKSDSKFMKQAGRAKDMLNRLDTLTSYLNSLAAARSVREVRAVSVSKAVKDFYRGVAAQAKTQSVDIAISVPPFDSLFTRPMHNAELASMLLNFYTNSLKAMKRAGAARKIAISAERVLEPEHRLRIRFSDTGDGIPADAREKVFEAFYSTKSAPAGTATEYEHASGSGLGLWIVKQIAGSAGGEVSVIDPVTDYSTTLEILLPPEDDNDRG